MTVLILEKEASPCRFSSPSRTPSPCRLTSPTRRSHRISKLDRPSEVKKLKKTFVREKCVIAASLVLESENVKNEDNEPVFSRRETSLLTPPQSRESSPIMPIFVSEQRRSTSRELSPQRTPSPCSLSSPTTKCHRISKPSCNLSQQRPSRISKSQLCLNIENARLQRENEALRSSNEKLMLSSQSLKHSDEELQHLHLLSKQESEELKSEVAHLKLLNWGLARKNERFAKEVEGLKDRMRKLEPLVAVGVKIRKRNFEKARYERYNLHEDERTIREGNRAAHEGDLAADAAMFSLGFLDETIPIPKDESERFPLSIDRHGTARDVGETMEESFKQRYGEVFWDMYGVEAERGEALECWGSREREVWDLCASMVSSCGGFFAGEEESGTRDFDRFNGLLRDVEGVRREIEEMDMGWEESVAMFEESREVMLCLYEMREIVDRTKRWVRDQRRGIHETWKRGRKEPKAMELYGTCILTKFEEKKGM